MPDAMCRPCEARGRARAAERLVDGVNAEGGRIRIPKCESCYKQNVPVALSDFEKQAAPDPEVLFPRAEAIPAMHPPRPRAARAGQKGFPMLKNRLKAQAERSAGKRVADIARALGVTEVTVYAHTRGKPPSKAGKPAPANAASSAASPSANGFGFRRVGMDEVPARHCQTPANAFGVALAAELAACPAGEALAFPVPAFSAKTQNPQGSIRGVLTRALRFAKQDLRFFVAVEKGQAWVWPRAGAANPSKGKAR